MRDRRPIDLGEHNAKLEIIFWGTMTAFVAAFATVSVGIVVSWMLAQAWNAIASSFGGPRVLWWQVWLGLFCITTCLRIVVRTIRGA